LQMLRIKPGLRSRAISGMVKFHCTEI
jgi:hypothetical protein